MLINEIKCEETEHRVDAKRDGELRRDGFGRRLAAQAARTAAAQVKRQEKAPQRALSRQRGVQDRRRGLRRISHERKVLAKSSALRSSSSPPVNRVNKCSSVPALCVATSSSGFPSSRSFPLSMIMTRSQTRSTTSMMCEL